MKVRHIFLSVLILIFLFESGQSFTLEGPKWPNRTYNYYINPSNLDGVGTTAVIGALKTGSNAWKTFCPGVYKGKVTTKTLNPLDGKNTVFFRNAKSGLAIATTYYAFTSDGKTMVGFDMVWWDKAWKFFGTTAVCSKGFYIVDVAAHEFGHVIGMGHSKVLAATMYYSTVFCNKSLRTLATDDINGAKKLYP